MKLSITLAAVALLTGVSSSAAPPPPPASGPPQPPPNLDSGFQAARDKWQCFHFFGSGKEGSSHPSINFELKTDDETAQWSLIVAKGSDFKKGLSYSNMNSYLCDDALIDNGICTAESKGFFRKEVFESEDHLLQVYLTKEHASVAYSQIQETDSYCTYIHNMTPGIRSTVSVEPDYIHGIPGSQVSQRRGYFVRAILSFLLIWAYVRKWQGKEMELDLMNKLIIVFFIGIECVSPLFALLQITFEGANWTFLATLVSFVRMALLVIGSASQVLFISLLAKGFTALSDQEFPLKSAHYRMAFILTGAYLVSFLLSFFLSPLLPGYIIIVIYIYQVTQYFKTNKLLASLSLRSSTRRAMTLKLTLFYLPLAYIFVFIMVVVILVSVNMDPSTFLQSTPEWSPSAELVGFTFGNMIDPLIFFIILIRYWTPEAIYQDSFGFEPTIDLNKPNDDDII